MTALLLLVLGVLGVGMADLTTALSTFLTGFPRVVRLSEGTFASLPASPVVGMLAAVSDSNTAVWGATVAGGGTDHVLAYFDGTNWTVAGK